MESLLWHTLFGSFELEVSLGNAEFGTIVWDWSIWEFRLGTFGSGFLLRIFTFRLGSCYWELSCGKLRLGTIAWGLSLGILRLGPTAGELSLGAARLGSEDGRLALTPVLREHKKTLIPSAPRRC